MASNDNSIYASAPFNFIVEGKAIYIHADLASRHSKPLDRLINGHMTEAQRSFAVLKPSFAVLEKVDEATFTRFVRWAYHGYYTAAGFGIRTTEDLKHKSPIKTDSVKKSQKAYAAKAVVKSGTIYNIPMVNTMMVDTLSTQSERSRPETPCKPKLKLKLLDSRRNKLREAFVQRKRTIQQTSPYSAPLSHHRWVVNDYKEVFLSHARLYVLAEQYDIQILRTVALEELQTILADFTLTPARTGDIIALLRYVYANTDDSVAGVEDIRTMLMAYVGYEMDELMKDKQFYKVMVNDRGPMLWDYMSMVAKRI